MEQEERGEIVETIIRDKRKSNLWGRLKRRNSSSLNLRKLGGKNWSTRSLPLIGSFGPLNLSITSASSSKSTPFTCPVYETLTLSKECPLKKEKLIKDFFSTLPNEVKLQILSHLSIKTVARASMVTQLPLDPSELSIGK